LEGATKVDVTVRLGSQEQRAAIRLEHQHATVGVDATDPG